jgi:succinyl-diaminopimelate desuccinylase
MHNFNSGDHYADLLALCCELINRPSVTPDDQGCQQLMADFLTPLGFNIESMVFEDTTNMWARKGKNDPLFCFAGHTDVVPSGPEDQWRTPPFHATEIDGYLHGRGAADMKGSLAAMLISTRQFVRAFPAHKQDIAFLITSDEEGPFINGTTRVVDTLEARNEKIDWCLVGEPSSTAHLGDIIKNGRRGSLTANVRVKGLQGHVAYPHLAKNPIHLLAPALIELTTTEWDKGNDYFPATSMQVSNIRAGTGATNVVPGHCELNFNFRFSTETTFEQLKERVTHIFDRHQLDYQIDWIYNGQPFLTPPGELVNATQAAIKQVMGYETTLSTSGGTSDGRFIAPTGAQVIELGPVNATIHQIDERVKITDLYRLSDIYYQLLCRLVA